MLAICKTGVAGIAALMFAACSVDKVPQEIAPQETAPVQEAAKAQKQILEGPLQVLTNDGALVYGFPYLADLPDDAPVILLFHQGGSNGRAEYEPLIPWLNENGFRVIAWDQRSGGKLYGGENTAKNRLKEGMPNGYCDAYLDLQGALDTAIGIGLAEQVYVWGSSYSGALVFQLAAKNPDTISGVMAFSPATGKPLADCLAANWVDKVKAPMVVFSPTSEMDRETTEEQKMLMDQYGVTYHVIENGIHGSSMLVDARTENDMSAARDKVIAWLKDHS